ncbi:flagellar motor protein MotB [Porphyrobacter sp. TH134]|nr:flagellar motor protein MotB [Porphyrobacter sp. TH134]
MLMGTAAMIAVPVQARDGQPYIGIEGGVTLPNDNQIAVNGVEDRILIDNENGWEAGGVVGYDFGAFRLEAEGSYKEFGVKTLHSPNYGVPTSGPARVPGFYEDVDGSIDIASGMVNALFDIGGNDGIGLSAGGGIGYALYDADLSVNPNGPGVVIDKDWSLAYQAIAQVRMPLNDNVDLGVKYRYFVLDKLNLVNSQLENYRDDFETHSVLATLTYNFGGRAEPAPVAAPPPPPPVMAPPPPPPPAAPPPPPKAACNTGPYIVFFDFDKSDITPEAAGILNNAITAYANCGTARVMLAGHTDTAGSARYNMALAERRNVAVRNYMTGRGVAAGQITGQAFGESQPRVPTADGVREAQNRRVEVTYGPGSGM